MKSSALIAFFLLVFGNESFSQVTYHGIVKITPLKSIKPINGIWTTADHTGNAMIDKAFDKFAAGFKTNPKAIKALEATAAGIKSNPQAYINPDGSVNKQALGNLITQKFATVGDVTVPSVEAIEAEQGDLR